MNEVQERTFSEEDLKTMRKVVGHLLALEALGWSPEGIAGLWPHALTLKESFRRSPYLGIWNGDEWLDFVYAATEVSSRLGIPEGPAQARLRKLCADGEVRAITSEAEEVCQQEPTIIPPSRWRTEDVDLTVPSTHQVAVSEGDFRYWLDQQPSKPTSTPRSAAERGKVPLIIPYLKQMFPEGVPDPAHYSRKQLRSDLLAKYKNLAPLDDATLKRAIDLIRNDPK
jgi:hypothetical protein